MTKRDKLIKKILEGKTISTAEVINLLEYLGYQTIKTSGTSHITYTKDDNAVTLVKNRKELKQYQIKQLQELLSKEGFLNE